MRNVHQPRGQNPLTWQNGTWLEDEIFCGPNGGMVRRARAECPDGKLRVFRCGIADTYFSIPVRGGGYLTTNTDASGLIYHPKKK